MNHWQCQEPAGLHPVLPEDWLIHLERGRATNKDSSWQLPYPAEIHTQLTSGQGAGWEASSSPQQTWPSHGRLLERQKDLVRKGTLSVIDYILDYKGLDWDKTAARGCGVPWWEEEEEL